MLVCEAVMDRNIARDARKYVLAEGPQGNLCVSEDGQADTRVNEKVQDIL